VGKSEEGTAPAVFESCPHCGHQLSPWEKVLLSVDRALMCKHCWYRIIMDIPSDVQNPKRDRE
jgi:DNA-directed RNA polymerase subunit RPC12/RpoP